MQLRVKAVAGAKDAGVATPASRARSPPPPRDRSAFASRKSGLQPAALVSASRAAPTIRRSVEAPAVSAPERLEDAEMLHTQHNLPSIAETAAEVQHAQHGAMNQPGLTGLSEGGLRGLTTGTFDVRAAQPISYSINEVHGLFDLDNPAMLRGVVPDSFPSQLASLPSYEIGTRRFIIMDENVYDLHGKKVEKFFKFHEVEHEILSLPTNEAHKDFDLIFRVADALERFGINSCNESSASVASIPTVGSGDVDGMTLITLRKEPIIAIGGGVCLDVAGLAANLFRRNTPLIKVPTTLMAAVDASVGIKTAVNFHEKKNKLGTYCPPLAVFLDRAFMRTLDQRNLSNGAAEMLKMACIKDVELFNILEEHADDMVVTKFQGPIAGTAMRRSIQGMLEELEYNLWEHILCRLVDYGHTFSPEIEMAALASDDELLHGEAVNIDMALTTHMSYRRGLISATQRDRVLSVMRSLQLPMMHSVCSSELFVKGLTDTTKARDGLQRMPLMSGIGGAVFVNDVTADEVATAAADLGC